MAKYEDLKRVDLKVSVNCCEGCKRKILKALSIKGVLKTDIHPTLPKITVIGNVDVQTLIRKLAKSGKTAELWLSETPKSEKEEKKPESIAKETEKIYEKERAQEGNVSGQEKPCSNHGKISKSGESAGNGEDNIKGNEASILQDTKSMYQTVVATIPQVNCLVNPNVMAPIAQAYYPTEPNHVPMAYCTMNAYSTPPPCCIRDHYHYELPVYHPPPVLSSQAMGFDNYFNDENTVGCYVM